MEVAIPDASEAFKGAYFMDRCRLIHRYITTILHYLGT